MMTFTFIIFENLSCVKGAKLENSNVWEGGRKRGSEGGRGKGRERGREGGRKERRGRGRGREREKGRVTGSEMVTHGMQWNNLPKRYRTFL